MLLDAARKHGVGRFVHVSTDEVYGSIDEGSWTEEWPLAPNSAYSASKAGSDLLVLAYHRTHKMDVVVTRCSNNYGHYQFPEKMIPLLGDQPASTAARSPSTATAPTSATGCTSPTTAAASTWRCARAGPARSTTSAAAPR